MSWDEPWNSPAGPNTSYWGGDDITPDYSNPYGALRYAKTAARSPEAGMRYEQNDIPAATSAPGCSCGNCPWRTSAAVGARLLAMPTKSLDERSDYALAGTISDAIRRAMREEGMTGETRREISIIPQTLDLRTFIILFVILMVLYVIIKMASTLSELQTKLDRIA